ncbi:hypothetical protein BLOT_000846 [Blomia tropicalis]|nr:hypothetical protein BLOT_000846 [Blomia tropicalis]
MGSNVSSIKSIKQNEYLLKVVSANNISSSDSQFWDQFLSFAFSNLNEICSEKNFMEENIIPLLSSWMENNPTSCNLGSFIQVFLQKIEFLKKDSQKETIFNIVVWHAYNLLFIMRSMIKYLIESITEENLVRNFKLLPTEGEKNDEIGTLMLENLLNAIIEIIVDINLDDVTYNLHVESCKTFLVLLSVQMFSAKPSSNSTIYTIVMQKKCAIHALLFTKTLMNNFINQMPAPAPGSGSIIFGLASGLWNVLTLGYSNKKSDEDIIKEAVLARECLLLLLVLTNHCTKEDNPYRLALFQCSDSESELGDQKLTGFKIEFSKLYKTLCSTLNDDQTTLLLYMLLHQNQNFKTFVLSRTTDLDHFVIPVLRILYNSPDRNSHHIYMALIILLVLSEDNLFNNIVHDITIKTVPWYNERNLNEISLGGLIILIIARTIHFNMTRNRDRFLHTNLCATLANMSNYFKHLDTCVCQKLVNLFEKLSKKYLSIQNQIEANKAIKQNGVDHNQTNRPDGDNGDVHNTIKTELIQDFPIFEEVLRTILEIINACLTKNLANNPNLVYALLYDRKVFDPFLSNPSVQDIIINIETVLTYFTNRIEIGERTLSPEEVLETIKHSSLQWPSEKLKKFPELRFRYVEDEQPEDFFIPYIWSLVFHCSDIFWSSQKILLFNPFFNYKNWKTNKLYSTKLQIILIKVSKNHNFIC